jgi:hypothetical protein
MEVLTSANPDDLHGVTSHLSDDQLEGLVAYLLSLPVNNSACVGCDAGGTAAPARTSRRCSADILARISESHPHDHAGQMGTPQPIGIQTGARPRRPAGRVGGSERVTGRVVSGSTGVPVPGALVTIRATGIQTTTGTDGTFTLRVPPTSAEVEVTAWSSGYYIASVHAHVPQAGLELELRRHHSVDNPDYEWVDPTPDPGSNSACGNCHPMILPQWSGNAHGGAISNPRFYSLYNGTTVDGSATVAPGYLLDFPGTTGICATCHAPGAAVDDPFTTDLNEVRDRLEAGIHCDFCHKLGGAWLRPTEASSVDCTTCHKHGGRALQSEAWHTWSNMPGVLSLKVLRPPRGEQIFFGPYPDIHDPDTYLPLMSESALCAPCHQFSFWGTPIYTSYDEWLTSPYSDPDSGQTCQDCHMPPTGDIYFALPEQGGLPRPPETIPSHLQVGASDEALLQDTVELEVEASAASGQIEVTVTVTNTGAGHHVPTDHPGRHVILEVTASTAAGSGLSVLAGPTIPPWVGSLEGRAGTVYAKLLQDVASGEWPVVSYWKHAIIRDDTRIPALGSSMTSFTFAGGPGATVTARVLFRRLYEPIAERYGWDLGEVVMEERRIEVQ